jgi:hypothetical protein
LTGASGAFTTAPASEEGGSLEAGASAVGEVPVFPFDFSLSLQKRSEKQKFQVSRKEKVKDKISCL